MRYVVAFVCGAIVGAFSLFLFLQETGRAVAAPTGAPPRPVAPAPRASVQSTPANSAEDSPTLTAEPVDAEPIAAPSTPLPRALPSAQPALSAGMPAYDVIVIPVAGIERRELRNTYLEARGTRVHNAIDILAPRGTPVLATVDGVVAKLFTSKQGGLTVYLADPRKEWIHYFAHLDRYAAGLREGQQVRQGELIGYVGITGNAPVNTPHLHFSLERLPPSGEWWKGTPTNPYPVFMRSGITYEAPVERPAGR